MANRGFLKRLLANWPVKVLSLAAALLLFFFYRLNRLEDRYISVPLGVSVNDDFALASQSPRSVRVTLRGESNSLFTIQEDDVRASLDLSVYHAEGQYRAAVQVERRGSALGVDPLEIRTDPAEVAVSIEKRVTRIVPVTPSFKGFLDPGYELLSFDILPSEVVVSGPTSVVARVNDIQTDFIELTGRSADFSAKVRVLKKESLVSIVGSDSVEFRANVQKSLAVKGFDGLPISVEGLLPGLALAQALPLGSLRLRSSSMDINAFTPQAGMLYVDLSAMRRPGSYSAKVLLRAPDGFTIERHEPQTVQVAIVPAGEGGLR